MARFPIREAEIVALAQNLVTGLTANTADFPAPPVTVVDLQAVLNSAQTLIDESVAARAAAEEATTVKNAGLEELIAAMRADLRYAEDAVNYNDDKLKGLGWAGKTARTPLDPPGQPRALEAPQQGEGWIFLDWKSPAEGGPVSSYKIERRERPAGDWGIVAMAIETETTLSGQERGKDLEYRVIAVNKGGEGMPSNTVAAVL